MRIWIQQYKVGAQSQVSHATGPHGVDVNSIVLSAVRSAPILKWKFQNQADSLTCLIAGAEQEKIDVSVIFY